MDTLASFDGKMVDAGDCVVAAFSMAGLYGKGIFTTVRIVDGQPFLWDKHWRRLSENAKLVDLDLSEHSSESTLERLNEAVSINDRTSDRARITFYDESPSPQWSSRIQNHTSVSVVTAAVSERAEKIRLTTSPYAINSQSPLAGVKSINYLEKILARREANQRGFTEAAMLNTRGEVSSAVMANLFWLAGGELITPSLETGCLAGTTREFILEKLKCREVVVGIDELRRADAIYLTSAGLGVVEVRGFDGKTFERADHPIMSLLNAEARA